MFFRFGFVAWNGTVQSVNSSVEKIWSLVLPAMLLLVCANNTSLCQSANKNITAYVTDVCTPFYDNHEYWYSIKQGYPIMSDYLTLDYHKGYTVLLLNIIQPYIYLYVVLHIKRLQTSLW